MACHAQFAEVSISLHAQSNHCTDVVIVTPTAGWQAMLSIIHVILLRTLQYLLYQILQMRWLVIVSVAVYRHVNLSYKILSTVSSRPYNAFSIMYPLRGNAKCNNCLTHVVWVPKVVYLTHMVDFPGHLSSPVCIDQGWKFRPDPIRTQGMLSCIHEPYPYTLHVHHYHIILFLTINIKNGNNSKNHKQA